MRGNNSPFSAVPRNRPKTPPAIFEERPPVPRWFKALRFPFIGKNAQICYKKKYTAIFEKLL